jgi:hypothetical protein
VELGRDKAWLAFHERRISISRFEKEMHLCRRDSESVDQYDGTRHLLELCSKADVLVHFYHGDHDLTPIQLTTPDHLCIDAPDEQKVAGDRL